MARSDRHRPGAHGADAPQVVETIRKYANIDPTRDYVPVKPTAHYTMGGIPVTTNGEVYRWQNGERRVVEGLYAAGECSCVSVHGANRLGGNSLLDACLFGTRSGRSIAARIAQAESSGESEAADAALEETVETARAARQSELDMLLAGNADDAADDNPYQLMAELGSTMERAAAVRCDAQSLATAIETIDNDLAPRAQALAAHDKAATFNQEITAIWEVRHLITLAQTVIAASDARHESRGSLKRTDFPDRDDEHFLAHSMTDAAHEVSWQPVRIVDMPPKKREY